MNKSEEAYCKHDLNVLYGVVGAELLSDMSTLFEKATVKYSFNGSKKELTEYAKDMKNYLLLNKSNYPCDKFSSDGKILYTENLFHTLKNSGFSKIAMLLGSCDCIGIVGSNLQIGNIIYSDTDAFYFKGRTILEILQESWGCLTATNEEAKIRNFKIASQEYSTFIDEELRLGRWMSNLGIDVAVNIYSVVEI